MFIHRRETTWVGQDCRCTEDEVGLVEACQGQSKMCVSPMSGLPKNSTTFSAADTHSPFADQRPPSAGLSWILSDLFSKHFRVEVCPGNCRL